MPGKIPGFPENFPDPGKIPGKIPGKLFPEKFPDTDNYNIKTRKIYKKILQIKTMFLVYQKFYM